MVVGEIFIQIPPYILLTRTKLRGLVEEEGKWDEYRQNREGGGLFLCVFIGSNLMHFSISIILSIIEKFKFSISIIYR